MGGGKVIFEVRFRFLVKCKVISIKEKDYIVIGSLGVIDRKLKFIFFL